VFVFWRQCRPLHLRGRTQYAHDTADLLRRHTMLDYRPKIFSSKYHTAPIRRLCTSIINKVESLRIWFITNLHSSPNTPASSNEQPTANAEPIYANTRPLSRHFSYIPATHTAARQYSYDFATMIHYFISIEAIPVVTRLLRQPWDVHFHILFDFAAYDRFPYDAADAREKLMML
jgi:hypothetical protein